MVNHGRGGSKSYGHKHKHDHAGKKSQTQAVKLLITPSPLWHEVELGPLGANAPIPSEAEVEDLLSKAKYLYEEEVKNYDKLKHDGKADWEFLSTVLKSGTVTDKVSAFTLMVQESPIHTLPVLRDHLVHGMARKKSRREALLTVDAIRDLAIGNILPDRRLRYFRDHPLKATGVTPTHLLLWYFEDALKKLYFEFLNILEELSKDPLTEIKSKALSYIADLLIGKPEQEANLLLLLVNKLGDQDRKVSSKASFLLCTVLQKHPVMSLTISREVERFIFRNGMNERSKYMALNFLNQIVLSNKDQDVACAKALVDIYMAVFEQLAKSESIREQRGPLEKEELKAVKKTPPKKKDSKKKDVKKDAAPKEDIGKVNSKILGAIFIGVNRAFPFAKLTETAFEKHLQTIYKITHVGTFNVSIQALSLVYQIETANSKPLSDRFYRSLYATLLDSRLTKTSKYAVYLNLIYRAVKNDSLVVRVQAFLKRLLQLCSIMTSPFTCASLFMFSEIARSKPGVWSLVLQPEDNTEESFGDVDEDGTTTAKAGKPSRIAGYDWKKRDPMHSLANASCLWELNALALHFHPTVSFYAKQLLTGKPIAAPESVASYDPLQNHTLSRFLDRFVYKNPKRTDTLYRGTSVMQPKMPGVKNSKKESLVVGGRKKGMIVKGVDGEKDIYTDDAPVNSVDWANVNEATIPTDEGFYAEFFKRRRTREKDVPVKTRVGDEEGEDEEDDGELNEDEIAAAMMGSSGLPGAEGVADEDSDDFDLDELEGDDGSDDDEDEDADGMDDDEDMELPVDGDSDDEDVDFDEMLADGMDSDDDNEDIPARKSSSKKKEVPKKARGAKARLAKAAQELGYTGDFFTEDGGDTTSSGAFASLEDFQSLIDKDSESGGEEYEPRPRDTKRKRQAGPPQDKKNTKKRK